MHEIRVLEAEEHKFAIDMFVGTLHWPRPKEEFRERAAEMMVPGRVLGAFTGEELIGTTSSLPSSLRVPGGAELPMAAVTDVGVRADHTRQGLLTRLQRRLFEDLDEPVAALRASEASIYGRFGYGIATRDMRLSVDRARASTRNPGTVRQIGEDEATKLLPRLHERIARTRAGSMSRAEQWWTGNFVMRQQFEGRQSFAVHQNAEGEVDGYVDYAVERVGDKRELTVRELWAADQRGYAELWRYVFSIDLIDTVATKGRPLDEPLDLLLPNPRAIRVTELGDELWLRLLDVPTALAAREYGPESVLLEVRDEFLPANNGTYRIGASGAHRVSEEAELRCDVATLAGCYLGDRLPSDFALAGLLEGEPDAVRRADGVFRTNQQPWCGTSF